MRKFSSHAFLYAALASLAGVDARAACDAAGAGAAAHYVIKGGEVYDSKTNLTWQRCSVGQRWTENNGCVGVIRQMRWSDAQKQAAGKWRVPTKDELASLLAPGCTNPAIDENAFPDMELFKLWYWTSTENGATAWYVAFGGGSVRGGGRNDLDAVRLVRTGK